MLLFHSQCLRGDVRGDFINSKIRRCAVSHCQYGMYILFVFNIQFDHASGNAFRSAAMAHLPAMVRLPAMHMTLARYS